MLTTPPSTRSRNSLRQAFSAACRLTGPLQVSAVHRGSGQEHTFHIRRPYATVGRGAGNDVRLNDPSVSRVHAFLQVVDGRVYCADLGSRTGVAWDDGRSGPGWICRDRSARLGAYDLKVVNPTPPAGRRPPGVDTPDRLPQLPVASLEVYRASDVPTGACPLDWPVTLVGRHPSCRLRLLENTVEFFQGCVVNTPDGIWWIDFSARRTSLVNGNRARLARLRDSDILEIGRVTLIPRTLTAGPTDGSLVNLITTTAMLPPGGEAGLSASAVAAMMAELRQCVTVMAQTFTALQQEHAAAVGEHLKQIQELTRELRQLRGEGVPVRALPSLPPLPAAPAPVPEPVRAPTPYISSSASGAALADAHAWFLGQLTNLSQSKESDTKRRS